MTKRYLEDYLQDILDAITAIEEFSVGVDFTAFSQNLEKVYAVSRAIEIIGEAVKRVPNSVRSQYRCRNYLESDSGRCSTVENNDL